MLDYKCPVCGNTKFYCDGKISGKLLATFIDGELDYKLAEWDDVEGVGNFFCSNCDFLFCGDEDEFLELLENNMQL